MQDSIDPGEAFSDRQEDQGATGQNACPQGQGATGKAEQNDITYIQGHEEMTNFQLKHIQQQSEKDEAALNMEGARKAVVNEVTTTRGSNADYELVYQISPTDEASTSSACHRYEQGKGADVLTCGTTQRPHHPTVTSAVSLQSELFEDDALAKDEAGSLASPAEEGGDGFIPKTIFKRADGSLVRAGEMKWSEDNDVMGPDGSLVRVYSVQKYTPALRAFVCIRTANSLFEVAEDHRLLCKGPDGSLHDVKASDVGPFSVYNGLQFLPVQSVHQRVLQRALIEICFEHDAAVLAWYPTTNGLRKVEPARAFTVRGSYSIRLRL
mmetsp:Transcript_86868/g.153628  ORF Transcript_86868/g.153628 Transcript_86868/m.153628 type:complete len:324 (-) Transcript_86868:204-1175(-)